MQSIPSAHQFSFTGIDGKQIDMNAYSGKVVMVVNTASECGLTGQYGDLQTLYETYRDKGFVIIGVPCNNFGNQEPGDESEIADFVKTKYGVTFPMTQKYDVKGDDAHPFFAWAESQKKGGIFFSKPRWNFHKFLIDQNGALVKSFGSQVSPSSRDIRDTIEALLDIQIAP